MDDDLLTLTHATERDVDLLLVEELVAGPTILEELLNRGLGLSLDALGYRHHRVVHSRRRVHNRREIDICVEIDAGAAAPEVLMIENKLDADEQVKQAASYREEAEFLRASGRAHRAWSLLVCPEAYGRANPGFASGFDGVVSYESLRDLIRRRAAGASGELGLRLSHRADMLDQAIGKARRGYVAVPLAVVSDFNRKYVALLRSRFPHLIPGPAMLKAANPGESVTMIFAPETLPTATGLPQMRLVHQLREANANLNFYKWGDHFGDLAEQLAPLTRGTGFKLQPTINRRKEGRAGLMVIAATPKVDNQAAFTPQEGAILEGMKKAEDLRQWFVTNRPALARIGVAHSN
jgi:hypothetical protein